MPKILFAVDGSEASLRAGLGLAGVLRRWKATDVEIPNVQPESFIFSELVPSRCVSVPRAACERRENALWRRRTRSCGALRPGARPHCGSAMPRRQSPARLRCSIAR